METYSTIDEIVRTALIADGEQSLHKYPAYLLFGLEALKDFYTDHAQDVKTVQLDMSALKQVYLPLDFVDWVKVGIVCGNRIKVMGTNDNMPILTQTDNCGNLKNYDNCGCGVNDFPDDLGSFGGFYFWGYPGSFINEYGEMIGGVYGLGGGYTDVGYFRLITNQGKQAFLQFDTHVRTTKVYVEYISNGMDPKKETLVNSLAAKAIRFYIHWQVECSKNSPASGKAQGWENQYYNELTRVVKRTWNFTPRDILELTRQHYGQAPKY